MLMKLEVFEHTFEKSSRIKFHENPFSGNRIVPCGQTDGRAERQTDRQNEAKIRFSQFCKGA